MADVNIRKVYDKLKSQYKLPEFESIDNDFEISYIEHDNFLLREIRRKISDKIEFYIKILEDVLQPDTNSMTNMHEYRSFDEERKKVLFNFYKELMIFHRISLILECKLNEKEEAKFILDIYSNWENFKKEMERIFEEMKKSWISDTDVKEELGYFG